ncbi:DNA polymerase III beta subunit [Roseiarcus fermentans]|uniref:Beta sliding clamp n=1 Tax=Roseiarcus fermentans TaxID=1473586 RepID=A0A366EI03_9HYPH|nr:DNA polymerase III subunit beta [Roseiarcus fermentans]RBP01065.1 DNA polymerase III beta subunit [Roseiarcus fermentans]
MKLTSPVKPLLAALAPVARVAPARSTIPVLAHVLVQVAGGRATIVADDLDREAEVSLAVDGGADGAACLPASTLLDVLKKLPGDALVSIEVSDGKATLRSGRSRFVLQTLPADDFPRLGARDFAHKFTLEPAILAGMIAETAFAISSEETRYYLNGVYWHFTGEDLRFVATDGHRLARTATPMPKGSEAAPSVIVPTAAIKEFARRASEAKDGEVATIALSPERIRLTIGACSLTTKLIDGTFPDYARIIPAEATTTATVDREKFRDAIDLALPVAETKAHATKFVFDDGSSLGTSAVEISVNNPDAGSALTSIEADVRGHEVTIGFNAKYVLEALAAFSAELVSLAMNDPGSPAVLTAEGASETSRRLLVVIMPLRV